MTSWLFLEGRCSCFPLDWKITPPAIAESGVAEPSSINGRNLELPSDLLGSNYEFLEFIGQGGMGSVFKVRDRKLETNLAVKLMSPELATNQESLKRFTQEAKAVSQLTHPNVVGIYGHGVAKNGSPYLLMDFIGGKDLSALLEKEVYLNAGRAIHIFIQIAEALAHAHEKGVVHRDLKPANIIISQTEQVTDLVKLVDFGIAKMTNSDNRLTHNLTSSADVIGTPLYMSPEQCLGFNLDGRSDIYSLGCLMCETLTGKPPYNGENPMQIIAKHLNETPLELRASLTRLDVPDHLQDVICACLAKNPQERYQNASALISDLNLIAEGKRPSVAGSTVASKLRSPLATLALELLPYAGPMLIFTVDAMVSLNSQRRLIDHCIWAAVIAVVAGIFYLVKAVHLKAISSLLAQKSSYNIQRGRALITTAGGAFLFSISQLFVYLDFVAVRAAQGDHPTKYKVPLYFSIAWLVLALIPFAIGTLKVSRRDRHT